MTAGLWLSCIVRRIAFPSEHGALPEVEPGRILKLSSKGPAAIATSAAGRQPLFPRVAET